MMIFQSCLVALSSNAVSEVGIESSHGRMRSSLGGSESLQRDCSSVDVLLDNLCIENIFAHMERWS